MIIYVVARCVRGVGETSREEVFSCTLFKAAHTDYGRTHSKQWRGRGMQCV